jgi:hypothetical protein
LKKINREGEDMNNMKNNTTSGIPYAKSPQERLQYQVDKINFEVVPIYKRTGESIHKILLNLMEKNIKKP